MPVYSFICSECGDKQEVTRSMKTSDKVQLCICGADMFRDFAADQIRAGGKDYSKPIHSDALAISPRQCAEHKRKFPDIKLDSQCRPVFDSYRKHQDYLDKCNIIKQPNRKGKRRSCSKRIA